MLTVHMYMLRVTMDTRPWESSHTTAWFCSLPVVHCHWRKGDSKSIDGRLSHRHSTVSKPSLLAMLFSVVANQSPAWKGP